MWVEGGGEGAGLWQVRKCEVHCSDEDSCEVCEGWVVVLQIYLRYIYTKVHHYLQNSTSLGYPRSQGTVVPVPEIGFERRQSPGLVNSGDRMSLSFPASARSEH